MVALIPGLLVPLLAVRGGQASLTAAPNPAAPGTTVTVTGANFPAHTRGALLLDGAATGAREGARGVDVGELVATLRMTVATSTAAARALALPAVEWVEFRFSSVIAPI